MDSFIDRNAGSLPLPAASGGRGRLKAPIGQLTGISNDQAAAQIAARGLTARLKVERTALVDEHMDPIRRIVLADRPHTPELKPLGVFDSNARLATLLQRAHGMAAAAAPFAAVFQEAGLPPTFMTDTTNAADALDTTFAERKVLAGQSAAATKQQLESIAVAARRTMAALNTLVKRDLKGNTALYHEWNSARKIRKIAVAVGVTAHGQTSTNGDPTRNH